MSFFEKSVNNYLTKKAGKAVSKLDPRLQGIVNSFFPGIAGGIENYSDNSFINTRATSSQRLADAVAQAGLIKAETQSDNTTLNKSYDWRARLRPKAAGADIIYQADNNGLLAPLKKAGGLVWQTTPNIFISGITEYNEQLLHGMNYPVYTYNATRPPTLPVTADFYANDIYDAQYLLAVWHFLRTVTKSYFGDQTGDKKGTPPPVLIFEYLGDHGFNKVPVILRDYTIQLPDDVDYIPVASKVNGEDQTTFMPTRMNISVNLVPSLTPKKVREKFNVEAFRNGKIYKDGFI